MSGMKLTTEQRISLEFATARYEKNLDEAADYLSSRGFTRETAVSYRLGVVRDPVPGDEPLVGRLSIPYITRAGVIQLRYRCLEDHDHKDKTVCKGKYWNPAGQKLHLYNVNALFDADEFIVICEGELDAITLSQIDIPAVGVPGTGGWRPHFNRIFEDYQRVYMFADGDAAGEKFGNKLSSEVGAIVISMPEGMDVNDAYLKLGAEYLYGRIEA